MAGEIIQAQYDELGKIADRFKIQSDEVENLLQRVNRTLQPLFDGGWQGEAAERFFVEMEGNVIPGVKRLYHAIRAAGETTEEIIQTIKDAEEVAGSPFRQAGETRRFTPSPMTAEQFASMLNNNGFGLPGTSAAGPLSAGNDYGIPSDWLSGVNGALRDYIGANFNDHGIPHDWLSGVTQALRGDDFGIPRDWLSDVQNSMNNSGHDLEPVSKEAENGGGSGSGGTGSGGGSGSSGESPENSPTSNQAPSGNANDRPQQTDIRQPFPSNSFPQNTFAAHSGQEDSDSGQSRFSYSSPTNLGGGGNSQQPVNAMQATGYSTVSSGSNTTNSGGLAMSLAAASPFLALAGKLIKDKAEKQ